MPVSERDHIDQKNRPTVMAFEIHCVMKSSSSLSAIRPQSERNVKKVSAEYGQDAVRTEHSSRLCLAQRICCALCLLSGSFPRLHSQHLRAFPLVAGSLHYVMQSFGLPFLAAGNVFPPRGPGNFAPQDLDVSSQHHTHAQQGGHSISI
jgi:hypothetical protein